MTDDSRDTPNPAAPGNGDPAEQGPVLVMDEGIGSDQPGSDAETLVEESGGEEAPKRSDRSIRGLFSTQSVETVGTGTTQRRAISKTYWYAEEKTSGTVMIQPVNSDFVPFGEPRAVERNSFLKDYNPEPELYQAKVYPKLRELNETIDRAEKARENGQDYAAEFEFGRALSIDEDNVRANFGLGLTYLDRGDTARAEDIFKRLVDLEAAFSEEHKHLFNDFGIKLRKSGLLDQALEYYTRALSMAPADENLHYNLARAYFEKGDAEGCTRHLNTCLEMNASHEEAQAFAEYVKNLAEKIRQEQGGAPVAGGAAPKGAKRSEEEDAPLGEEDFNMQLGKHI